MGRRKKNSKRTLKLLGAIVLFLFTAALWWWFFTSVLELGAWGGNLYEGEVVLKEYCKRDEETGRDSYCAPMKAVSDRETGKAHSVSEGVVAADRAIQGGTLKLYLNLGSSVIEDIGSSAVHRLKVEIYNYELGEWEQVFSQEHRGREVEYTYELGETKPRVGGKFTKTRECTPWYEYRGYQKKVCTYWDYEFDQENVNPENNQEVKLRLDMYAEGRDESSVNVAEVHKITADFVYASCPECPEPSSWSGCDLGETEEWRTNYKCSAETSYQCEEFKEYRPCNLCENDEECQADLQECFAVCDSGRCEVLDNPYEPPCEEASWLGYPTCEWDKSECQNTDLLVILSLGGLLVLTLGTALLLRRFKRKQKTLRLFVKVVALLLGLGLIAFILKLLLGG